MTISVSNISSIMDGIDSTSTSVAKASNVPSEATAHQSFTGPLQQALNALQRLDDDASTKVNGLLSGNGTDIHTAMIATQKASLAFEASLAIRNKAVGAYQQIMGMQF